MAHFEDTWKKVEKLELTRPLAQLGSYLRSQPNTGVDKQNFSDSPSDLQLANLFNELKDANPDIRDARTGQGYKSKDFEFWRDNRPLQSKCAEALRKKRGGERGGGVDEKITAAMQMGTVLRAQEISSLVAWEHYESWEKAVTAADFPLAKGFTERDCEESRYLARGAMN